jgi:hypothetical protein
MIFPDPYLNMKLKNLDPDPTTGHEVPVPVLKFPYFVNEPLRYLAVWRIPDPEPIFLRA